MAGEAAASSQATQNPEVRVIRLVGDVDMATVPALAAQLNEAAAVPGRAVVVDLSGVTFMDCSGLRPLLDARVRLDGRLRLQNASRSVRLLLRHLDLSELVAAPGGSPPRR